MDVGMISCHLHRCLYNNDGSVLHNQAQVSKAVSKLFHSNLNKRNSTEALDVSSPGPLPPSDELSEVRS